jgi:myo-inositol 2-dehydrogenase/D-chiro-inositol 1-dehydrogenase
MKQIKIGIIGIGRMGQIHLDNLMQKFSEVEVVAISDINEEARQWAEKYTISKFYFDYQDLISDQEVNTVVICSPTNQHAENIIAAAQAGKNIFCEKPMDLSIQTATKVLQIVEKAGVKFMLGFNRRFDPNFMKIKGLIEEGKVGDPQIVKITSRDPAPPPIDYIKSSGGMFLDMTIHDFDMARFMVSSKVISIFAVGRNLVDPNIGIAGDIDTAVVTITFDSGAIATIDNSRQAVYGYDQRLEVFGSEGMAGTENNKSDNHYYYNKKGQSESLPLHFFMDRYILSYFNEIKAFIDCIVHDEVPKVGGQDGLISLAMGWAANTSMRENRVVMLKEMLN